MKGTRASEGDRNKWEKLALLLRKAERGSNCSIRSCMNSVFKEYEKALSGKRTELLIELQSKANVTSRSCPLQLSECKDTQGYFSQLAGELQG